MKLNTVIFDMVGLLIDSEPLWQEAAAGILIRSDIVLTDQQYHESTGMGTRLFVQKWMAPIQPSEELLLRTEKEIIDTVVDLVRYKAEPLEGVNELLELFRSRNFKIGLATGSPFSLIGVVIEKLGISKDLKAISSANELPFGKPHPQVYLDCAEKLDADPTSCICFEDSFNGLIAAKAARMTCVVVPAIPFRAERRWDAADMKLDSLLEFTAARLDELGNK